jgi:hypothetical protein
VEESDDSKDNFCGKLQQVFDHIPKISMKILSADFNATVGREDILKPTNGNGSLHHDNDENSVSTVVCHVKKASIYIYIYIYIYINPNNQG